MSRTFEHTYEYVLVFLQIQWLQGSQHTILVHGVNLERHATIVQPKLMPRVRVVGCCPLRNSTATILTTAPHLLCRRLLTKLLECAFYIEEIGHAPMPWAQGVTGSNPVAPAKSLLFSAPFSGSEIRCIEEVGVS